MLPAFYLNDQPTWFTSLLLPRLNSLVPTMSTLEKIKTDWSILSRSDSNYLVVKLKCFQKDGNREFRLVQKIATGESEFNLFVRLRKQLALAAQNFGRDQTFSNIPITTLSKVLEEQSKLVHKVIDVVDHPNRNKLRTFLRYKMFNPRKLHAPIPNFCTKEEEGKNSTNYLCQI